MKKFDKMIRILMAVILTSGSLAIKPVHAEALESPGPSGEPTATPDSSAASQTADASPAPEGTAGSEATPTASVEPTADPSPSASPSAVDEVIFIGEEEKTIAVGEEYVFTDPANVSVQGPDADGEVYRVFVRGVEGPEEGSYVYIEGDVSFTPTEADIGLDYVISYGAEVSTDGETWAEVEDSYFETYLTVGEDSQESPSVPPILRTPIYEGMIAQMEVDLDEETPTGSLVTTTISLGINGSQTVDEPFLLEVDVPKEGIYGTGDDVDVRYRLQISDLPDHESTFTENDTYYIKTYTFQPSNNAQSFAIPMKLKFLRTGEVGDGTEYHITLKILDQQGNVIKTTDNKTTLKVVRPNSACFAVNTGYYKTSVTHYLEEDSPALNADKTALTTDAALLSYYSGSVVVAFPPNSIIRDNNNDQVGIRKTDHIIDTITFPSEAVIDTERLPSGAVYNAETHTVTIQQDNVVNFKGSNGRVYYKIPGAVIGQEYTINLRRDFIYDNNSEENFALEGTSKVKWAVSSGWVVVNRYLEHSQSENYDSTTHIRDNNIDLNSEPYIQGYLYFMLGKSGDIEVTEEQIQQHIAVDDADNSYSFVAENDNADLAFHSVVLNPSGAATSYIGTVTVVGVKEDGTETTIASNFAYPDQSSATINISDEFILVKVLADSGSYFIVNNKHYFDSTAPEVMRGLDVRFTFKLKSNIDVTEPHLFTGTLIVYNNDTSLSGKDSPRLYRYRYSYYEYGSTGYSRVFHYYFYFGNDEIVRNKLKTTISPSDVSLTTPGQVFSITESLYAETLHDRSDFTGGVFVITVPDGMEVVQGSESIVFNQALQFEKTASEIIASRQDNRKYHSGYPRNHSYFTNDYQYNIGTISNIEQLSLEDPILTISYQLKYVEPRKGIYESSIVNTEFNFPSREYEDYNYKYTFDEKRELYGAEEYKYFYSDDTDYIDGEFVPLNQFVTSIETKTYKDYLSTWGSVDLLYQKNDILNRDVTRSAGSGYDYYNDEITFTYHLVVEANATETYNNSKATLTLPSGLQILSASVVSNNDNFSSDKSLSDIGASFDGNNFDLGNVTITSGKNVDLTFTVKVKVTDQVVAGQHTVYGQATFVNSADYQLEDNRNVSSGYAVINYVPTSGFYTMLTGHDTTEKEYIAYGSNDVKYEITLGNYTGLDAKNITIIDMLPGPGDCNGDGSTRNSDLRPILTGVSLSYNYQNSFAIYYSVDEPSPGMTAAEYNAIANWSTSYSSLENVRAIKISAGGTSGDKKGELPTQTIGKIATITMRAPEASDPEAYGELINNSISVQYVTGSLTSNFIDSNVKTYETVKSHKVRVRFFFDENGNDIYDSGDTFDVGNGRFGLECTVNSGDDSQTYHGKYYSQLNPTGYYVSNPFPDYLYVPVGEEFQITFDSDLHQNLKWGYGEQARLCSYSSAENGSKVHDDLTTDVMTVDASSPDIIYINVGIKFTEDIEIGPNEALVIYDYNGGHNRVTGQTRSYGVHTVHSTDTITIWPPGVDYSSMYYPYHFQKPVWTTNQDGSGTSYVAGQSAEVSGVTPGQTIIIYAQWEEITEYTVRYDKNSASASGTMSDDIVQVGDPYTIRPNLFTYSAGTFINWNAESDGTGADYLEGQVCNPLWDGDLTHASWWNYDSRQVIFKLFAMWKLPLYTFITDQSYAQNTTRFPGDIWDYSPLPPEAYYADNPLSNIHVMINSINNDGSKGELVSEATSAQHGELYFPDVTPGVYYLTEETENIPPQHFKPEGSWKIKVAYSNEANGLYISQANAMVSGMEEMPTYSIGYGKVFHHYIINSAWYYKNLTLTTRIADENEEYASIERDFTYRLIFLDKQFRPIANQTFEYEGVQLSDVTNPNPAPANGTITTDENGRAYVTLKHGQGIKIKNVVGGTKVTVKLITEGGDVHSRVNDEGSTDIGFAYTVDRIAATTLPDTEAGLSQVMDFEIHNFVPVPAGISSDSNTRQFLALAYAAAAVAAGLLLLLYKLRKKLREQS